MTIAENFGRTNNAHRRISDMGKHDALNDHEIRLRILEKEQDNQAVTLNKMLGQQEEQNIILCDMRDGIQQMVAKMPDFLEIVGTYSDLKASKRIFLMIKGWWLVAIGMAGTVAGVSAWAAGWIKIK